MTLIDNKKLLQNYEVLESFEAGIELLGFEVKSLRAKHGTLLGAYAIVRGAEIFLMHASIPAYQEKNTPASYDPERNRKLLMKKSEILRLSTSGKLTIVPISMYSKGGKIKVEIAIVRGKKQHDKRQALKKRDTEREIARKFAL